MWSWYTECKNILSTSLVSILMRAALSSVYSLVIVRLEPGPMKAIGSLCRPRSNALNNLRITRPKDIATHLLHDTDTSSSSLWNPGSKKTYHPRSHHEFVPISVQGIFNSAQYFTEIIQNHMNTKYISEKIFKVFKNGIGFVNG